MHALIIGATGATGSALLSQLLADDNVTQVSILCGLLPSSISKSAVMTA